MASGIQLQEIAGVRTIRNGTRLVSSILELDLDQLLSTKNSFITLLSLLGSRSGEKQNYDRSRTFAIANRLQCQLEKRGAQAKAVEASAARNQQLFGREEGAFRTLEHPGSLDRFGNFFARATQRIDPAD